MLDEDAAIGTHRKRVADRLLGLGGPDRHRDDLGCLAGLLEPDRLFDGDFIEGIHRHLDIGKLDARAVGLDPDLDVEIDDPLDRHQHLH